MRFPCITFCLLAYTVAVFAQTPMQPGERLRSPEISNDAHVTFRLAAPQATKIEVRNTSGGYADWPGGNLVEMTKDSNTTSLGTCVFVIALPSW